MLAFIAVTGWVERRRSLSGYILGDKIGEGAMGVLFEARGRADGQAVAVKVCKSESAEARERFGREVAATAEVDHPNTVQVLASGVTPSGAPYYAMELLDGADLEEIVSRRGPLPPAEVAAILEQVAGALAAVHDRRLVHRDIKPANVVLTSAGVAKLIDFGLVSDDGADDDRFVGTPHYASPEQIASPGDVGAKSDVYALGALGFFLLTGRPVFDGDSVAKICCDHIYETAPDVAEVAEQPIPGALASLIAECLDKRPADRPDARSLEQRLAEVVEVA